MQYLILYNPHAGNGRGEENALAIQNVLPDEGLTFQDMTKVESYRAFFEALPRDTAVVICGGDGTLNRFLNETANLSLQDNLFYYPGGSGNDFLRDVADKEGSGLIRLKKYIAKLPTVTVQGKQYRFLNGVGYGIDGYCCLVGDRQRAQSQKKVNYTSIAIQGLLFHYKPTSARITVDGVCHTYDHVWLAPTMYGRFYGGGMMPTPEQDRLANPEKLSVMVYHCPSKLKALTVFPSIFKGEHVKQKKIVEILTGENILVEFDRPTPLQIDGETIPNVTSYRALACAMALAER